MDEVSISTVETQKVQQRDTTREIDTEDEQFVQLCLITVARERGRRATQA